ncbi:hypothetical protein M422DRAFT_777237 [Sphaerobolus stellatus SS14]|nr:hypothetical protein M422DRAFT_777237 [Sphaerobolus stellatus SS14]
MHIILTGATGTCGSAVLKHVLAEPRITRVSVLSRRPVSQAEGQKKVHVILHEDFAKYPDTLLAQLKGAHACIWALGPSQIGVTKEEYVKMTHDYPMAAAKALSTVSQSLNFVFISATRADQSEGSGQLYGRIKGRAEKHLFELAEETPSLKVYAARPAFIDPQGNHIRETPESLPKRAFLGTMSFLLSSFPTAQIGSFPLAKALTTLALGDGKPLDPGPGIEYDGRVVKNIALRKLAGI